MKVSDNKTQLLCAEECKQTAKEVLQTEATAVEYEPVEDEQTDGGNGE